MIELLIFGAGCAVGALALALPYHRAANDRDLLQAAKDSLAVDVGALKARLLVVKGDNGLLELENQRLAGENVELQRENGRFAAEIRQLKQDAAKRTQPRDPATGRMLPNPNAKRPRKSRAKAAPIACG